MKRWGVLLCLLLSSLGISSAQVSVPPIDITLVLPSTQLTTGQAYPLDLTFNNVTELWLVNLEISYDPTKLYIIGTQSGRPIRAQGVLNPSEVFEARNLVQNDKLIYTTSLLAPANPSSESGVLGRFEVYPLAAGDTTLTFSVVEAVRVSFEGEGETRQMTGQNFLPVAPVNLTLTVTGDTVEIPVEATATPQPTPTEQIAIVNSGQNTEPTVEPTFVQGLVLTATPTPELSLIEQPTSESGTSPLVLVAGVLIVVAVLGLGALFVMSRRK
jgi:hypothetical protein